MQTFIQLILLVVYHWSFPDDVNIVTHLKVSKNHRKVK